jgi:calcineurin-like phosphoesterase family protein
LAQAFSVHLCVFRFCVDAFYSVSTAMKDIYVISDPHFSDWDMLSVHVGNRPFNQLTDMNEELVARWNSVVRPQDHVYCLGDVAMKRRHLGIVHRLQGHKRLIFGNHDIYEFKEYVHVGFQKLMGYRVLDNIIMSHVPIALSSMGRFRGNIHGHLHNNFLRGPYLNVCVERINYTPIHFDEAKKLLQDKQDYENSEKEMEKQTSVGTAVTANSVRHGGTL